MSVFPLVAALASVALVMPMGSASGAQLFTSEFYDSECFSVDSPIVDAALLCIQFDDTGQEAPRWGLQNNTEWVLDLFSEGAWAEPIEKALFPSVADLTAYFTRRWTDAQAVEGVAVQPGETVFMPAYLSYDGTVYLFPEGELRFNAAATTAMIATASALASADEVATDRSKLYKIVKRMKACATAGGAALLATEQTSDAYAVVLADLGAISACNKYLKGVATQAKVKPPASWRIVALEFSDNFFIEARNAAIKLLQFAR
jgi:hypothetical protein